MHVIQTLARMGAFVKMATTTTFVIALVDGLEKIATQVFVNEMDKLRVTILNSKQTTRLSVIEKREINTRAIPKQYPCNT